MKISKILGSILSLLILNSVFSTNFILKTSQNSKKLSSYVCKVTKDIISSKSNTQDILIGNLGEKMWSSTVNDIAGCFGQDTAIVVSDFNSIVTEKTLRKATMVILTFDKFEKQHYLSTVWHHMANIIIVMPNDITVVSRFQYLERFIKLGFINVVTVHETAAHDIRFETYLNLGGEPSMELNDFDSFLIFPDKLRDMAGYGYKIVVFSQIPKVIIRGGYPKTPLVYFMTMIQKIQNATIWYEAIRDEIELSNYWAAREMDLTLNTGIQINSNEPKLMIYEESGYCALIPKPTEISIGQVIFVKPFDGLTWLFLFLTMACSVAVWWMFYDRGAVDSPWLLAYGMFVMFIGQGVDFSRNNRLVLTILLELIIVMVWILCNAYEGVITSFMIEPIRVHRLETFDDLVASNHAIITDEVFAKAVKDSGIYKSLMPRLNSSGSHLKHELAIELERQHYTVIISCEIAEVLIDAYLSKSKRVSNFYYMLPQMIFPHLEELEASYLNPFIERFQYYMDLSFQAGLMHIWKFMSPENRNLKSNLELVEETSYLEIKDLALVFRILIVGYVVSTVLFLLEIFFHDLLVRLTLSFVAKQFKNRVHQISYAKRKQPKHPKYQKGALYYIINRHKRVKRLRARRLKVRRIYVQPRFPVD
ncbi:hypothetical protein ACKWTF_015154 [Chironomus riparius]